MKNKTIKNFFLISKPIIDGNKNLREPQIEGWNKAVEHFKDSTGKAIIQIPVGCGKTGLMALLPLGISKGRVLVIAPNVEIREGIYKEFSVNSPKCFWTARGVLSDLSSVPDTAVLDGKDANISDCEKSHIVIANIQQIASRADKWLPSLSDDFFDLILIDEGHHNVAASWKKIFHKFANAKVISLTATPFRSDKHALAGNVIYKYSITRAMQKGYIKEIGSINVIPKEISFVYKGKQERYTRKDVMRLNKEEWFSLGVALAPECNASIVNASIRVLHILRETGTKHQIIAVACSLDHARQVCELYNQREVKAEAIHSGLSKQDVEKTKANLRMGYIDCIVQVYMLGEGFDHPMLSIAAIFRPFRSLSPYIQFVGRIMRVIKQNCPKDLDNEGLIVSHVGLNLLEHWRGFKKIDSDDQLAIEKWIDARDIPMNDYISTRRKRFTSNMNVLSETIDYYAKQNFLDLEVADGPEEKFNEIVSAFHRQGLDMEEAGFSTERLRQYINGIDGVHKKITPRNVPVSPQNQRKSMRKRLYQRSRSLTNRLLKEDKFHPSGKKLCLLFPEVGGNNDFAGMMIIVNNYIEKIVGCSREKATFEQLEAAYDKIDEIGDKIQELIKNRRAK